MASWTDRIPQFNPYIQQLPVEAMVKVGMEKQKRYDEGLQKIQTHIENVAGLDIVRDVDKAYLQSKLNELGNNLKTVAAGDFSNFQLVNSVSGMTNQIVKDSNVKNAVSSTAWYRKQLAEMEKAISDGKSSIENVYDFNQKANEWLSSTDVSKSFRDRYTPYVDVKKKALEVIKTLHPKLQQYDVPFKIDENGRIDTRAIADAMKRYKIEGIDENQIKQALTATLTPDDLNQMEISAKYQFRDVDSAQLVKRAEANYTARKEASKVTLEFLKQQRGITTDPNEISKIDDRIAYEESLLGKEGVPGLLDEELKTNIELATKNPNYVKTALYKDGFIKELANGFSWKNQTTEYVKNPIREQMNWVADMKFKQQQENRRQQEFQKEYALKVEGLRLKAEENALKKVELYGDPAANDWTPLGNPTDNKLMAQEYFTDHTESVASQIDGDMERLGKRYTKGQINEMLNDWQTNGAKATKIKPDALTLIQNISKNNNYLESLKAKEAQLRKEAEAEVGRDSSIVNTINQRDIDLANLNRDYRSVQVNVGGVNRTISPYQLAKDLESGVAKLRIDKAPLGKIAVTYYTNGKAQTIEIPKRSFGVQPAGADQLRPILLGVGEHLNKYRTLEKDYTKKVNDRYLSKLAPLASQFVPQIKAVAVGKNGAPPPVIVSRLSQLLTAADVQSIAADANFDINKASEMLLDKNNKDTRIFIEQDGDNYKVHLTNGSDLKNRQTLKLSRNDVVRYFGPGYVNDKTQESIRLNIGKGNTNLTGDPTKALLQKQFGDFPNINNFQVTADLNEDLSDPNLYTPMINVKTKDGRYATFEIAGNNKLRRVGYDQGVKSLNELTDATLLKLLKEQYPNYDFSKLDY